MEKFTNENDVVNQMAKHAIERIKVIKEEEAIKAIEQEGLWVENLKERNIFDQGRNAGVSKRVKLVVTTPMTEEEYMQTDEYITIANQIYNNTYVHYENEIIRWVDLDIVSNNTDGLPIVYNRYMNEEYKDWIVCFIHDDLLLEDINFFDKLQKAHKNAEIVGLAGATELELPFKNSKFSTWNEMASVNKDVNGLPRKSVSGFVAHQDGDRVWGTSFGESDQYCRIIDGLFMSFNVEKCIEYDFSFDTRFNFHHYDISACVKAQKLGLRIRTAPIHVIHKGMGTLDKSWGESHKQFVAVYSDFTG